MEETRPTTKYKNTDIIRGAIASGTIRSDIILETTFFLGKIWKVYVKNLFYRKFKPSGITFSTLSKYFSKGFRHHLVIPFDGIIGHYTKVI